MSSIETIAAEIIIQDRKIKAETKRLEALKKDLLGMLQSDNIGGVDVKEGKITVCTRTAKDYGQTIKELEATLKAEKARLDHLGQFVISSVTHYLRVG